MATLARPAACVVLVRPVPGQPSGWQTYLVQRSSKSPVLADFWVFPGGTVRPDDQSAESFRLARGFSPNQAHAALTRPPGGPADSPEESLAYFVAAARELFEEAGILLGKTRRSTAQIPGEAVGSALEIQASASADRLVLESGRPFAEIAAGLGIELELERLVYYGHWITPEAVPQRFDTRFFLAVLPDGQEALPSPFEIARGEWIGVSEALSGGESSTMQFHFATQRHLERLAPFRTLGELLTFARTKPVPSVMPSTRESKGRIVPQLPPALDGAW